MDSELLINLPDIEKLIESFAYLNSYEELIDNIKKQIDIVAKNDTTGLYLFSKEENKLKLFYAKGFSEQEKNEAELTAMDRHPGHVFSTGNILLVADQDLEHNEFSIDSKKKSHTRSRMYVPVRAKNLIIGAFGIQSEKPNAFTEEQLAVFKVFAALAGNAYSSIENNLIVKKQNEENEKLSLLAKSTTNNVIFCDKDGKITWVNKHFEESTGYFLDEIKGKTPGSFLIGKDTDPEKTNELRTAILNKKACNTHILNYKKNGEPYIVAIKLSPVFNETGDVLNFVAIQEDISKTEKQKAIIIQKNEQLKLREEQYNNIVNTTNDFIVSLNAGGQIQFANKSWLEKMNYHLDEVIETNIFNYIHPDSQAHCMLIFNNINKTENKSFFIQYNLINKDKVKIEVEGEVVITYNKDGIYTINSYLKDVTEINKLRIEKENKIVELKESKEKLENVLGSLSESIWGLSLPSYKLEYISQSAVALYGYPLQDWYDNVNLWSDLIHPEDKEFVLKESEKLFDVGQVISEYRIITADKKEKWIHSETKVITNEKGIPILMTGITRDITLKKATLIALQENNEKLENVLGSLSETTWGIALPSYKLEYISQSAVALYGYPLQDWYDNVNLWVNLIHPDDKEFVLKENEKLFSDGKVHLEYRIIAADKKVKYLAVNTKVVNNNEGIPTLLTGIAEDITAKKLAEIELLNYKNAIDRSAIVSITDVKGNITYVNEKFCEISKYSKEELMGENHRKINSGFHPPEFFQDMWKTILGGNIWNGEIQNKAKDGSIYYVQSSIIPFMKDGKPYQFVAIRYESTEKVLAKLAVDNQRKFYETILNNIPGNVAVFDIKGNYIFINPHAVKDPVLREWLIGKNNYDYCRYKGISSEIADERNKQFELLKANGYSITSIETKKLEDGSYAHMNSRMNIVEYKDEKLVIAYGLDITEINNLKIENQTTILELNANKEKLELALKALNETNKMLSEAQEIAHLGSWTINPKTNTGIRSTEFYKIYEISKSEYPTIFENYLNLIHPDDRNHVRTIYNNVLNDHQPYQYEARVVTKDGKIKNIVSNGKCVEDDTGKLVKIYGTVQDISDQKKTEIILKKNITELEKTNAELDKFVYSTSHDLRAPLKSIMGLINISKESTDTDINVMNERLEMINKSVQKLDNFIEDILQYSRNSRMEVERDEINYEEMIHEIRNNLKFMEGTKNLNLQVEIHKGETFFSDKRRISVILNNLVSNAIKYSDDSKENMFVNIFVECSKENATITIEDNGIGIADKDKEKIFKMFYRATNLSTGSGLGMYIVKESLDKLGGTITLESELTKGTKFIVEIPNLLTSLN